MSPGDGDSRARRRANAATVAGMGAERAGAPVERWQSFERNPRHVDRTKAQRDILVSLAANGAGLCREVREPRSNTVGEKTLPMALVVSLYALSITRAQKTSCDISAGDPGNQRAGGAETRGNPAYVGVPPNIIPTVQRDVRAWGTGTTDAPACTAERNQDWSRQSGVRSTPRRKRCRWRAHTGSKSGRGRTRGTE